MRTLIAALIFLGAMLLLAGCLGGDKGAGGGTPSGGAPGGTVGGTAGGAAGTGGAAGGTGTGANQATVDSAGSSDFENPVSNVTQPDVDATSEDFPLPA